MDLQALAIGAGVGLALQLAMVFAGHRNAFIKDFVFAAGGMAISLAAGLIYGKLSGEPLGMALLGGAVAGGACAFLGIAVSVLLKDVPATVLAFGALASAVTGVIGAALGRMLA